MTIYKIERITGTTEAGWQLTEKQRADLLKKAYELNESLGAKVLGVYRSCADGMKVYLVSYPSLEAYEKQRVEVWSREGLGLSRYWTCEVDILYELPPGS